MRRFAPLYLILILAACQPSTATPDALNITPSATQGIENTSTAAPTETRTPRPTQTPRPTLMPPLVSSLPSTNNFRGLIPDGAEKVLGIGGIWHAAPSPDRTLIAVSTTIGLIMFDATTYEEVWSMLLPSFSGTVAWSPDSTRIAINEYQQVSVWDALIGSQLGLMRLPTDEGIGYPLIYAITWPSEGTTLALSGTTGLLWDYTTDEVLLSIDDPESEVQTLEWLAGDTHMISSSDNQTTVWDVVSGQPLYTVEGGRPELNREGTLFVTYPDQDAPLLIDAATGNVISELGLGGQLSPDWTRFAVPLSRNSIAITLVGKDPSTDALVTLYNAEVAAIRWSPDNLTLATLTNHEVKLWDVQTGLALCSTGDVRLNTQTLDEENIRMIWLPEQRRFLTFLRDDPAISIWDAATCQRIALIPTDGQSLIITPLSASQLLIKGRDVAVWDTAVERSIFELVSSGYERLELQWSEDSTQVIAIPRRPQDDKAIHWRIETGEAIDITPTPESIVSEHPYPSPDGTLAIRLNDFFYYEVYDIGTDQAIREFNDVEMYPSDANGSFAWSPDGRRLVANMLSGLYVWDVTSWQLIDVRRDLNYGYGVAFSPDGQWLAVNVAGAIAVYPAP